MNEWWNYLFKNSSKIQMKKNIPWPHSRLQLDSWGAEAWKKEESWPVETEEELS